MPQATPRFLWRTMTFAGGFIHSTWLPRESQRLSRGSRLPACSCWSAGWALWLGAMLTGSLCDSRLSAFLTRALQEPGKTLWFQCGFHTEYPAPPNGCRIGPRGGFCKISWFSVSSTRWWLCQWPNQGTGLFTCIFILNLPARNQHTIKVWIFTRLMSFWERHRKYKIRSSWVAGWVGGLTHSPSSHRGRARVAEALRRRQRGRNFPQDFLGSHFPKLPGHCPFVRGKATFS